MGRWHGVVARGGTWQWHRVARGGGMGRHGVARGGALRRSRKGRSSAPPRAEWHRHVAYAFGSPLCETGLVQSRLSGAGPAADIREVAAAVTGCHEEIEGIEEEGAAVEASAPRHRAHPGAPTCPSLGRRARPCRCRRPRGVCKRGQRPPGAHASLSRARPARPRSRDEARGTQMRSEVSGTLGETLRGPPPVPLGFCRRPERSGVCHGLVPSALGAGAAGSGARTNFACNAAAFARFLGADRGGAPSSTVTEGGG